MNILDKRLIVRDVSVENSDELLDFISDRLMDNNLVQLTFREEIKKRETNFPTGLKGCGIAVAMPHTNAEHVKEDAIGVFVLKKPIKFLQMGTDDEELQVEIVFPLILKDAKNHMDTLQKMMVLFQNEDALLAIKEANDNDAIFEVVNAYL